MDAAGFQPIVVEKVDRFVEFVGARIKNALASPSAYAGRKKGSEKDHKKPAVANVPHSPCLPGCKVLRIAQPVVLPTSPDALATGPGLQGFDLGLDELLEHLAGLMQQALDQLHALLRANRTRLDLQRHIRL